MSSMVYVANRVHTMTGVDDGDANAVLVRDGRIAAVGRAEDLTQVDGVNVVDFGGGVITPGLNDSHSHAISGAISDALGLDLTGALSIDAVRGRLESYVDTVPDGEWILAWGLDPTIYEGGPLVFKPFADIIGNRPALINFADQHSLLASPAALQAAGITGAVDFPNSSASIACYEDGTPTGHVLEFEATAMVRAAMPPLSDEQKMRNIAEVLNGMAASGLTGSHVMDLSPEHLQLLRSLEEREDLGIKLRLHPFVDPIALDDVDREYDYLRGLVGQQGRRWAVTGVKFFMDGSIDGGTAWLQHPDVHGDSDHGAWSDQAAYKALMHRLVADGVSTVTHAIGDGGVLVHERVVRDLMAEFHDVNGGAHGTHSIEHLEMLDDEAVREVAGSGVYLSMMPLHCTRFLRADHTDNWSRKLGDPRDDMSFRTHSLLEAGATIAIGSDWPVAPYDPRWTMADGVLRRPFDQPDVAPIEPEEAMTAEQLLYGYTVACAEARGERGVSGRLAPGYVADLTVFGDDPLSVPAESLGSILVLATVVDGELSYQA